MANRIKNGTKYTPNTTRGTRAKGSLAVRTLRDIARRTRNLAMYNAIPMPPKEAK